MVQRESARAGTLLAMADIIDGAKIAADIFDELTARVEALKAGGTNPTLAAVLVGDDPASAMYVRMKRRDARKKAGVESIFHHLPEQTEPGELEEVIDGLNADPAVHGILLQIPIPKHLDEDHFLRRIDPAKDVDGLHPFNQGLLMQGRPRFVSATPAGVKEMLVRSGVPIEGQHVVVVGRSVLVGRPLSVLLSNKAENGNATVTLCHTRTRDLESITKQADILVVAAGVPKFIGADAVSEGTVVIDVGTTVMPDGTYLGDVDFEAVSQKARAISPVPGGVGPMTRVMLIANTVQAAEAAAAASA
jgi:methylenetetrahydrofolate dehydrogenase (NADP+)/methenyltetrahydrofolate cyclohydrolase